MTDQLALSQLLTRQNLVITRNQALDCGMQPDVVYRRLRAGGQWRRMLPGVYLTVTGTPTPDQRDMAALLYAGPGGTLTGAAALRRHGMRIQSQSVDVLVPASRRRQNSGYVVVHPDHQPASAGLLCGPCPVCAGREGGR